MSNLWAERQRRTNELVRAVSGWMLYQPNVTADQLYGLCKLTWITNSFDVNNRAYIASTKVPALSSVFAKDYTEYSLQEIANDASSLLGESSRELIVGHTGFTNFYKAYRNSARPWFEANQVKIAKLFRRAFELSSDQEGESLMEDLATLPSVPKAKSQSVSMAPESILTPALFSLDKRMRFPLINGNKGVKSVLKALGAHRLTLGGKYAKLITLYGQGGIQDAADLDQIGHDLPSFISVGGVDANRRLFALAQDFRTGAGNG